jgi:hypothetical protein
MINSLRPMEISSPLSRQMKDLWLLALKSEYRPKYYEAAKH